MSALRSREPRCVSYCVQPHTSLVTDNKQQPIIPHQICKLTPLCCLPKPLAEYADEELDERDLYLLINWLHEEAFMSTSKAVKYGKLIFSKGLVNIKKLAKHIDRNVKFLQELNIPEDDIEDIHDALGVIVGYGYEEEVDDGQDSPSVDYVDRKNNEFTVNYTSRLNSLSAVSADIRCK